MKPHLSIVRPLAQLTLAERRIKEIEPRDFRAEPWMRGEGAKFWTVERVAKLKAENEVLRAERNKRMGK